MADEEYNDDRDDDDGGDGTGAFVWRFIGLSVAACVSFWAQAVVTEERLVPALNVIAEYYNIPDDIAGATLMAAGASSPELLSSWVSLFVTHSSLGLGTIIGSEIFNQLIICAGSVFASKTGHLRLDRTILAREVGFYALSILLLYVAVSDRRVDPDDPDGPRRIYVTFGRSCLVLGGYVLYVVVCAKWDAVISFVNRVRGRWNGHASSNGATGEGAEKNEPISGNNVRESESFDDLHQMPFIHNITSEPEENWEVVETEDAIHATTGASKESNDNSSIASADGSNNKESGKKKKKKKKKGFLSRTRACAQKIMCHSDEPPVEIHDVYELMNDGEYSHEFQCYLWQRSIFYSKAHLSSHSWQLRWFTLTPDGMLSVPDRREPARHVIEYPKFEEIHVDERRFIIHVINPVDGRRDFTFMAPTKSIFGEIVQRMTKLIESNRLRMTALADESLSISTGTKKGEKMHDDLVTFPSHGNAVEITLWLLMYPLRWLMHRTLPDVRRLDRRGDPTESAGCAARSSAACLGWLFLGSYVMCESLVRLAALTNVPDAVVGFTVSAAGTSLPAYVASRIAAENGFGNQAVSNVFGSNTFNITVGLGLPWALYTSFATGFEPYDDLRDEGLTVSILILAGALLIFVVLMFRTDFVLLKWHGVLFVALYAAYIAFAISQAHIGNDDNQAGKNSS